MSEATLTLPPESTTANTENAYRILIIDDEAGIRESLETLLWLEGYTIDTAPDGEAGLNTIGQRSYDLVLLDLALPGMNGIEVLGQIRERYPDLPVIMITAYGTVNNVVDAIRAGSAKLRPEALGQRKAPRRHSRLDRPLPRRGREHPAQARPQAALQLRKHRRQERIHAAIFDLVAQVAPSRSTILILGESGTGKELIAKALHANSPRRDKNFVPVNTGSMPTDLLESTLFGHVKGAFTSAIAAKKGYFEIANGGTLFLDEIGNMSMDTQAKILRVIQDKRFMHLGGVHEIQVDVRIIAATNVDLRQAVREGRFREDLYYRLNVISIDMPPLRARREDIPLLAAHFLKRFSEENDLALRTLAPDAIRALMDYDWPGNVRELENVIERGVVLSSGPVISSDLLPGHLTGRSYSSSLLEQNGDASLFDILEDIERRIIIDKLERCHWNQTDTAEQFRIPLSTLNQKIKRLNIEIKKRVKD